MHHVIFTHLFGCKSKLAKLLITNLSLMAIDYMRFMLTYFTTCQFSRPRSQLVDHPQVVENGLMDLSEYNQVWHDIKQLSESNPRGEALWMKTEQTLNDCLQEMFMLSDKNFQYKLGLDNDKVHYNFSYNTNTAGLKRCRHVRDNQQDFTAHTCAHSATGVPVAVVFQRKDDTCSGCFGRIV
jgi:hypothetical protein